MLQNSLSPTALPPLCAANAQDIAPIAARMNLTVAGAQMPRYKALELRKGYFAATSFNDYLVGKLLAALDASGLAATTTVVLWGDVRGGVWSQAYVGRCAWWCLEPGTQACVYTVPTPRL